LRQTYNPKTPLISSICHTPQAPPRYFANALDRFRPHIIILPMRSTAAGPTSSFCQCARLPRQRTAARPTVKSTRTSMPMPLWGTPQGPCVSRDSTTMQDRQTDRQDRVAQTGKANRWPNVLAEQVDNDTDNHWNGDPMYGCQRGDECPVLINKWTNTTLLVSVMTQRHQNRQIQGSNSRC
jgi:hypothetical protein